jgi:hypothetical protein
MATSRPFRPEPLQLVVVVGLAGALAYASFDIFTLTRIQAAGADFSCFWAGAKAALDAPARIYDFHYVSELQGWPLGPGRLRPFIYPPSGLLLFAPLAAAPYWVGYGAWVAATLLLFLWAARRIGAPWWMILLAPTVSLVVYTGQVTFLVGGLVLGGLSLRERPLAAGVLFGLAAAVKPQFLLLVPVALAAEGRWRTLLAAGSTGLALCLAAALVWGAQLWLDWLAALARFNRVIFDDPALVADAVTPYAALVAGGHRGAWAWLLAPFAAWLVWAGFRRTRDLADRGLLLFGATLLVTPYAMNYELALFAPGLAVYLQRLRSPLWPRYAAAALGHFMLPWGLASVLPPLALPLAALLDPARRREAPAR